MATITPDLKDEIQQTPEKEFSVIITVKEGHLPPTIEKKGKYIMGNKIFSARLNGQDIQSLENNREIEAIEKDMEMGIL